MTFYRVTVHFRDGSQRTLDGMLGYCDNFDVYGKRSHWSVFGLGGERHEFTPDKVKRISEVEMEPQRVTGSAAPSHEGVSRSGADKGTGRKDAES